MVQLQKSESKICTKIASVPAIQDTNGKLRFHEPEYMSLLEIPPSKNISIIGGGAIPVYVGGYFVDDREFACDRHIKISLHHPSRFPPSVLIARALSMMVGFARSLTPF